NLAQLYANQAADANIQVSIVNEPAATFGPHARAGDWSFYTLYFGQRVDTLLFDLLYAPSPIKQNNQSICGWTSDEFRAQYAAAQRQLDPAARLQSLADLQKLLASTD